MPVKILPFQQIEVHFAGFLIIVVKQFDYLKVP